jgi:hypothetical protein
MQESTAVVEEKRALKRKTMRGMEAACLAAAAVTEWRMIPCQRW